ncbi:MAG TPA: class I SAM-dependent methyltransferase [Actinomycetales bacterium]
MAPSSDEIARGWDEAVDGYERYYVPRFAPWVETAVLPLAGADLPDGPVLVPCCGTFPELAALASAVPHREVTGIDLSGGMVARARDRAGLHPGARVEQGDASTLEPRWSGACAAVVSVFGLQQLPDPAGALASWAGALRPGGLVSVAYWPRSTEDDGPFALLAEVLTEALGGPAPHGPTWEDDVVPALRRQGLDVVSDQLVRHAIEHPDAATCFEAHVRSGPLRPLVTARGEAFVGDLRARVLARAPAAGWSHRPAARHVLAHRPQPAPALSG